MNYTKLSDAFSCIAAFLLALILKYESFSNPFVSTSDFVLSSIILMAFQLLIISISGLSKTMWRYVSINDIFSIVKVASFALVLSFAISFLVTRLDTIHRTFLVINWILLVLFLMAPRLIVRIRSEKKSSQSMSKIAETDKKIIIVGAGVSGLKLLKDILVNPALGRVVGFLDDDKKKAKREVLGCPVLGFIDDLPIIVERNRIDVVFIAIPTASGAVLEKIIEKCNEADVPVKTLPKVSDILRNVSELAQLRNVTPEDLLGRDEVVLDKGQLESHFENEVILVTGAGGSIGSELCRQIASYSPRALILFEQSEFNLYQIEMDLKNKFPHLQIISLLGDVRDKSLVRQVFQRYVPNIVYHAAAYKHVPMVEKNPFEGIRTNVVGTKVVAQTAGEFGAKSFVLISTDKAVNPTNIMGATKRTAELVIQKISAEYNNTKFSIVRFGNVLGSSGSVIPLFKQQIESGGPVTLTHESIERYFMSIPEATRLVIQASLIGNGGEIFVLDMGRPVKIIDLARKMITLSGLKEGRDIQIKIIGLRPGEKLYEELLADKEETIPTEIQKIRIAKVRMFSPETLLWLQKLQDLNETSSVETFRNALKAIVPEYMPMIVSENQQLELNSFEDKSQVVVTSSYQRG
jgi:FlaA1/EpsC-like NDP-sugar epimerase